MDRSTGALDKRRTLLADTVGLCCRFVEPGAHVEEFDVLVEVQSDKASVEITSRYTGRLVEHCYQVGQVARVGSPLCRIELEGRGSDGTEVGTEEQTETQKREPGTDVEEQGRTSGHSEAQFASEQRQDDEAVNDDGQTLDRTRAEKRERHRTLATPAVRRLTRENGLQIGQVLGTGRDGRVTKEDVQNHLSGAARSGGTPVLQDRSSLEEERQKHQGMATTRVAPLSGVRKAMFKAMSATWTAPHFGYSEEVNVTKLDLIRKQLAQRRTLPLRDEDGVDGENVKLTLLPFLLKALSLALQNHPLFRSTLDVQGMNLIQSDQHRLSLAFASSKGLVTPALRGDVRQLSIIDIARQIANLQKLGAVRGLSQEELGSGATVTLSNIGSIGGTHTFPLIPPTGQLVIGAVGRTRVLPRFDEAGNVVKASILPVSFSADHRVVEGVELARFVDDWKRLLEEPTAWLLHMH